MIVTIGTDDTLASPGAQLDYYQSVLNKMGREQVDAFARFFVLPQTGHGLPGLLNSVRRLMGGTRSVSAITQKATHRFDTVGSCGS